MLPEQNGVINTHLKILCELGLLGFVLYILILAYPYYLYVKKYHLLKFLSKNLINGLLIGYSIYIFISFQSTLQFWTPYFWMIYVLLITVIREKATINISQIITIDDTYKKRRKIFNVGN
jgi:O-antigen ligase